MKRTHPVRPSKIVSAAIAIFYLVELTIAAPAQAASLNATVWQTRALGLSRQIAPLNTAPLKSISTVTPSTPVLFPALRPYVNAISAYGRIGEQYKGQEGKPVVFVLQDIHMNIEAQKNIGEILNKIPALPNRKAVVIGVEAASNKFNFASLRVFPDKAALKDIADGLLKKNLIAGVSWFGMTAQDPMPSVYGIDNPKLYTDNVNAFKQSSTLKLGAEKSIEQEMSTLSQKSLSEEGQALFTTLNGYRRGDVAIADHIARLSKIASVQNYPDLNRLSSAVRLEKSINQRKAQKERDGLIATLTQKNPQVLNTLLSLSLAYQAGELNHGAFYGELKKLSQKAGINLEAYPALFDYVQYVTLADGIDAGRLFIQVRALEKEAIARTVRSPSDKAIFDKLISLHLRKKLVNFEMTPEEWKEYSVLSSQFSESLLLRTNSLRTENLNSFESFYRLAEDRNHKMVNNLLSVSRKDNANVAFMIAGGFHSHGMLKLLRDEGASYIVVSPKFSLTTDSGSEYLNYFLKESAPLAKLFEGRKLTIMLRDRLMGETKAPAAVAFAPLSIGLVGFAMARNIPESVVAKAIKAATAGRAALVFMSRHASLIRTSLGAFVVRQSKRADAFVFGNLSLEARAISYALGGTVALTAASLFLPKWVATAMGAVLMSATLLSSKRLNGLFSQIVFSHDQAAGSGNVLPTDGSEPDIATLSSKELWEIFLDPFKGHRYITERFTKANQDGVLQKFWEHWHSTSIEQLTAELLPVLQHNGGASSIAWLLQNPIAFKRDADNVHNRLAKARRVLEAIEAANKRGADKIKTDLGMRADNLNSILSAPILRVVYVASEIQGLWHSGGIGMVADAYPKSLWGFGHDVVLVMPYYKLKDMENNLAGKKLTTVLEDFDVPMGSKVEAARLLKLDRKDGPPVYLIESKNRIETETSGGINVHYKTGTDYFAADKMGFPLDERGNRITKDTKIGPYFSTEPNFVDAEMAALERFIFFTKATPIALELAARNKSNALFPYTQGADQSPEVVHLNDWHTALMSPLLDYLRNTTAQEFEDDRHKAGNEHMLGMSVEQFSALKSFFRGVNVATIHNAAYQGLPSDPFLFQLSDGEVARRSFELFKNLGLPVNPYFLRGGDQSTEYFKRFNFLLGIQSSDYVTTVSVKHAKELQIPADEGGYQYIQPVFEKLNEDNKFEGIQNGIGYDRDPSVLKHIEHYTINNVHTIKPRNKEKLMRAMGFLKQEEKFDPNAVVISMVGRMVDDKGWQIVEDAVRKNNIGDNVYFVFLGTGKGIQEKFEKLQEEFPNVKSIIGFKPDLANQIMAGSDIFLAPSIFEPSGLVQWESMILATLPIVTDIGGLSEVIDPSELGRNANGFKIRSLTAADLFKAGSKDEKIKAQAINIAGGALVQKIREAVALYRKKDANGVNTEWRTMMENAMKRDSFWANPTDQYIVSYRKAKRISDAKAELHNVKQALTLRSVYTLALNWFPNLNREFQGKDGFEKYKSSWKGAPLYENILLGMALTTITSILVVAGLSLGTAFLSALGIVALIFYAAHILEDVYLGVSEDESILGNAVDRFFGTLFIFSPLLVLATILQFIAFNPNLQEISPTVSLAALGIVIAAYGLMYPFHRYWNHISKTHVGEDDNPEFLANNDAYKYSSGRGLTLEESLIHSIIAFSVSSNSLWIAKEYFAFSPSTPIIIVFFVIPTIMIVLQSIVLAISSTLRINNAERGGYKLSAGLKMGKAIKISWLRSRYPFLAAKYPNLFNPEHPDSLYQKIPLAKTIWLHDIHPSLARRERVTLVNERNANPVNQLFILPYALYNIKFLLPQVTNKVKGRILNPFVFILNSLSYYPRAAITFITLIVYGLAEASLRNRYKSLESAGGEMLGLELRRYLLDYRDPEFFTGYTQKDLEYFNSDPEVVTREGTVRHLQDILTEERNRISDVPLERRQGDMIISILPPVRPTDLTTPESYRKLVVWDAKNKSPKPSGSDSTTTPTPSITLEAAPSNLFNDIQIHAESEAELYAKLAESRLKGERTIDNGEVAQLLNFAGAGRRYSANSSKAPVDHVTKGTTLSLDLKPVTTTGRPGMRPLPSYVGGFGLVSPICMILNGLFSRIRSSSTSSRKVRVALFVQENNRAAVTSDIRRDPNLADGITFGDRKNQMDISFHTLNGIPGIKNKTGGVRWFKHDDLDLPRGEEDQLVTSAPGALASLFALFIDGTALRWAKEGVKYLKIPNGEDTAAIIDGNELEAVENSGKDVHFAFTPRKVTYTLNWQDAAGNNHKEEVVVIGGRTFAKKELPGGVTLKLDANNNVVFEPTTTDEANTVWDTNSADLKWKNAPRNEHPTAPVLVDAAGNPIKCNITKLFFEAGGTAVIRTKDGESRTMIVDDKELPTDKGNFQNDLMRLANPYYNTNQAVFHIQRTLVKFFGQPGDNDYRDALRRASEMTVDERREHMVGLLEGIDPGIEQVKPWDGVPEDQIYRRFGWKMGDVLNLLDAGLTVMDRDGRLNEAGYNALKSFPDGQSQETLEKTTRFTVYRNDPPREGATFPEKSEYNPLPNHMTPVTPTLISFIVASVIMRRPKWAPDRWGRPAEQIDLHKHKTYTLNVFHGDNPTPEVCTVEVRADTKLIATGTKLGEGLKVSLNRSGAVEYEQIADKKAPKIINADAADARAIRTEVVDVKEISVPEMEGLEPAPQGEVSLDLKELLTHIQSDPDLHDQFSKFFVPGTSKIRRDKWQQASRGLMQILMVGLYKRGWQIVTQNIGVGMRDIHEGKISFHIAPADGMLPRDPKDLSAEPKRPNVSKLNVPIESRSVIQEFVQKHGGHVEFFADEKPAAKTPTNTYFAASDKPIPQRAATAVARISSISQPQLGEKLAEVQAAFKAKILEQMPEAAGHFAWYPIARSHYTIAGLETDHGNRTFNDGERANILTASHRHFDGVNAGSLEFENGVHHHSSNRFVVKAKDNEFTRGIDQARVGIEGEKKSPDNDKPLLQTPRNPKGHYITLGRLIKPLDNASQEAKLAQILRELASMNFPNFEIDAIAVYDHPDATMEGSNFLVTIPLKKPVIGVVSPRRPLAVSTIPMDQKRLDELKNIDSKKDLHRYIIALLSASHIYPSKRAVIGVTRNMFKQENPDDRDGLWRKEHDQLLSEMGIQVLGLPFHSTIDVVVEVLEEAIHFAEKSGGMIAEGNTNLAPLIQHIEEHVPNEIALTKKAILEKRSDFLKMCQADWRYGVVLNEIIRSKNFGIDSFPVVINGVDVYAGSTPSPTGITPATAQKAFDELKTRKGALADLMKKDAMGMHARNEIHEVATLTLIASGVRPSRVSTFAFYLGKGGEPFSPTNQFFFEAARNKARENQVSWVEIPTDPNNARYVYQAVAEAIETNPETGFRLMQEAANDASTELNVRSYYELLRSTKLEPRYSPRMVESPMDVIRDQRDELIEFTNADWRFAVALNKIIDDSGIAGIEKFPVIIKGREIIETSTGERTRRMIQIPARQAQATVYRTLTKGLPSEVVERALVAQAATHVTNIADAGNILAEALISDEKTRTGISVESIVAKRQLPSARLHGASTEAINLYKNIVLLMERKLGVSNFVMNILDHEDLDVMEVVDHIKSGMNEFAIEDLDETPLDIIRISNALLNRAVLDDFAHNDWRFALIMNELMKKMSPANNPPELFPVVINGIEIKDQPPATSLIRDMFLTGATALVMAWGLHQAHAPAIAVGWFVVVGAWAMIAALVPFAMTGNWNVAVATTDLTTPYGTVNPRFQNLPWPILLPHMFEELSHYINRSRNEFGSHVTTFTQLATFGFVSVIGKRIAERRAAKEAAKAAAVAVQVQSFNMASVLGRGLTSAMEAGVLNDSQLMQMNGLGLVLPDIETLNFATMTEDLAPQALGRRDRALVLAADRADNNALSTVLSPVVAHHFEKLDADLARATDNETQEAILERATGVLGYRAALEGTGIEGYATILTGIAAGLDLPVNQNTWNTYAARLSDAKSHYANADKPTFRKAFVPQANDTVYVGWTDLKGLAEKKNKVATDKLTQLAKHLGQSANEKQHRVAVLMAVNGAEEGDILAQLKQMMADAGVEPRLINQIQPDLFNIHKTDKPNPYAAFMSLKKGRYAIAKFGMMGFNPANWDFSDYEFYLQLLQDPELLNQIVIEFINPDNGEAMSVEGNVKKAVESIHYA